MKSNNFPSPIAFVCPKPCACAGEINKCCLNWSAQQTHILEGLRNLVTGQDDLLLTDVTLACDGEYVQAHKLVLSLCSSFFKDLFQKNRADKSNTIVILGNVSAKNLRYLLQFMYQGRVDIPSKDVDNFLQAGNVLKIEGLMGNVGGNASGGNVQRETRFPGENLRTSSVNNAPSHSAIRSYPPPAPASKKSASTMATYTNDSSQVKKPRLSEPSTSSSSSTTTTTALQIKIIGPGTSSVNQSTSSLGTGATQFHPGEREVAVEEDVDFALDNVKSEPLQVFSGFKESGHSEMIEEGEEESCQSYEESVGDDSYEFPPESSALAMPTLPVSVSAAVPGASTSTGVQAGGTGSRPSKSVTAEILDGTSYFAIVASKSSGWVRAKCLICERLHSHCILINGLMNSSSNFLKHLQRKHPEKFEAYNQRRIELGLKSFKHYTQ